MASTRRCPKTGALIYSLTPEEKELKEVKRSYKDLEKLVLELQKKVLMNEEKGE